MTLVVLQSSAHKVTKLIGETTSGRSIINITENKGVTEDPLVTLRR